jgi:hypothetical protein
VGIQTKVSRPGRARTDSDIRARVAAFAIQNEPAVSRFLAGHPDLLPLLDQLVLAVRRHVGQEAPIALEVFRDPEATGHEELCAAIGTTLPADDALRRLSDFDEEWWLDAMPAARGKLMVTLSAP